MFHRASPFCQALCQRNVFFPLSSSLRTTSLTAPPNRNKFSRHFSYSTSPFLPSLLRSNLFDYSAPNAPIFSQLRSLSTTEKPTSPENFDSKPSEPTPAESQPSEPTPSEPPSEPPSESSLIKNQQIQNNEGKQESHQEGSTQRPPWKGTKHEQNMKIIHSLPWKLFSLTYYFGLLVMFGYMGAFFYHFLVTGKYDAKSKRMLQICAKIRKLLQNPNLPIEKLIPEVELMASHLVYNNEVAPFRLLESEILKEPGFRKLAYSNEVEHRRLFSLIITLLCQAGNKEAKLFLEQDGLELLEHLLRDPDQIVGFHTLDSLYHLIDSSESKIVTDRLRQTSVEPLEKYERHWSPLSVSASRLILARIRDAKASDSDVALQGLCKAFGFNTSLALQEINIEIADGVRTDDPFVQTSIALWYIMHNRKSSHCYDLLYSAIEKDPNNKLTQFTLALYWFRRAYFNESFNWIQKVIRQDPEYWPVLCLLYNAKQWLLGYYWSPVHEWFDRVNSSLLNNRSSLDERAHDVGTFQNFLYMWVQPNELPPEEAEKARLRELETRPIHAQMINKALKESLAKEK